MAGDTGTAINITLNVALSPAEAFAALIRELVTMLAHQGIGLEAEAHGTVIENEREVGRVVEWQPGALVRLRLHPTGWNAEEEAGVEIRCAPIDSGARVQLQFHPWANLLGDPGELVGWFASAVAAPLLQAAAPARLGDWLTDRSARRPSGAQARDVYRDPLYHYPNFHVILRELALTPDDSLIEVGCGGGAFLKMALASGCRAAAVDHSFDMVRLAREVNYDAVAEGRLVIHHAPADHLPFPDASFTRAAMTGVLGFLPDPVTALREIRRVLCVGGRLVMLGSDPELRGTPAAPEPMASRLRFYDDDALRQLGEDAGFDNVQVVRRDLEPFARQAGVPEEHLALFAGPGARFLLATKD